jgi:uncharacterized membrane protein
MLVVVLDDESKAYKASRVLKELDAEGSITVYATAVISKSPNGMVTVKQIDEGFPIHTFGGTAIGSLLGILGGPIGLGIGAVAGAMAGSLADLSAAGVNADFLDDTAAALTPGKSALVTDISEEWITPVDTRMEALGGAVIRSARTSVEDEQRARDIAALREEIDQLKAEYARAQAERKAKLQAKIDQLTAKLQVKSDQFRQRSEQIKSETEAKVRALHEKAAKAPGDIKATLNARANHLREQYERSVAKQKHLLAGQLRAAAGKLEE